MSDHEAPTLEIKLKQFAGGLTAEEQVHLRVLFVLSAGTLNPPGEYPSLT